MQSTSSKWFQFSGLVKLNGHNHCLAWWKLPLSPSQPQIHFWLWWTQHRKVPPISSLSDEQLYQFFGFLDITCKIFSKWSLSISAFQSPFKNHIFIYLAAPYLDALAPWITRQAPQSTFNWNKFVASNVITSPQGTGKSLYCHELFWASQLA